MRETQHNLLQTNPELEIGSRCEPGVDGCQPSLRDDYETLQRLNQRLENTRGVAAIRQDGDDWSNLATGVAHEINNPIGFVNTNLSTLKSYCDLLERSVPMNRWRMMNCRLRCKRRDCCNTGNPSSWIVLRRDVIELLASPPMGLDPDQADRSGSRDFARAGSRLARGGSAQGVR